MGLPTTLTLTEEAQRPRYGVSFGVGGRLTDTQNVVQIYNGALSARKNTNLSVELKVTVLYKS